MKDYLGIYKVQEEKFVSCSRCVYSHCVLCILCFTCPVYQVPPTPKQALTVRGVAKDQCSEPGAGVHGSRGLIGKLSTQAVYPDKA